MAHPAAVLPFRRTRLVFSALVVGSLIPDLSYFLFLSERLPYSHTLRGLFVFCLPAGFALLWLYHAVVKRPVVSLAPEAIRRRITEEDLRFSFGPLSRTLNIILSLLLGSFTHLFWDAFTHDNGYFVRRWPWFQEHVDHWVPVPYYWTNYKLLQYGCSAAGVFIVCLAIAWWWRKSRPQPEPVSTPLSSRTQMLVITTAIVVAVIIALLNGYWILQEKQSWKPALVQSVVTAISMICIELLAYSGVWYHAHAKNP